MTKEQLDRINRAEEIQRYTENRCEALENRIEELEEVRTAQANLLNKDIIRITNLEAENAELKAQNKWYSEQVCNKECAEVWGQITEAKDLIRNLLRVTYDEGWNYSLDWKVKAEQFLEEE